MNSNFFDLKTYFIDEKVNIFKFKNCYKVFNDKGNEVGSVNQKLTSGEKAIRLLLNKTMLPFHLEINDASGNLQASISRGWTFFMSTIRIDDAKGNTIGSIKQKFKLLKPTFKIYNKSEELVAVITGDMKAWNFQINDASDKEIGIITKKWNGALKEIFTTADKYKVDLNASFTDEFNKKVILSSAITIDMVWRESR
ncbi:phospholipid scramblase-related protein [Polaribacter undariae]|uniref:Phospholipid scramblase-related protein n=1 Tax=Polaribacter sejongensis TaxID=985043 RepID=A0AAJ1QTB8_9FLAO|nr:phospholipid scramblase family protein [Polaribacter undariae]MDN3617948.1 phospholipid scramblase-related protein [Polaribacter undariae]UWD32020.1 phospholipid scramblase family protein [Polaribacter undariae]